MTKQEVLKILQEVNDIIDSMTKEELYDHMMATSSSFRKLVESLEDIPDEEHHVIPHPDNWHPALKPELGD